MSTALSCNRHTHHIATNTLRVADASRLTPRCSSTFYPCRSCILSTRQCLSALPEPRSRRRPLWPPRAGRPADPFREGVSMTTFWSLCCSNTCARNHRNRGVMSARRGRRTASQLRLSATLLALGAFGWATHPVWRCVLGPCRHSRLNSSWCRVSSTRRWWQGRGHRLLLQQVEGT